MVCVMHFNRNSTVMTLLVPYAKCICTVTSLSSSVDNRRRTDHPSRAFHALSSPSRCLRKSHLQPSVLLLPNLINVPALGNGGVAVRRWKNGDSLLSDAQLYASLFSIAELVVSGMFNLYIL